ncbi:MAG: hypothetical protein L3J61_01800 [Ghiorsea sp.]|nr:hypothetical protein [Ghiorsea sp.]
MTAGLTLFFYWLRLVWLRRVRPDASLKVKVATLIVIIPLIIYPFTYGPLWWLRGLTGDLSIVSTVLLLLAVIRMVWNKTWISPQENRLLLRVVAGLGLLFYPLALGVGNLDPYVWGYANGYMLVIVLGLSLFAFLRQHYVIATILLAVVLAWSTGFLQSVNIWDYLLDPFIFFYALFRLLR